MATSDEDTDTEGCDDPILAEQIIKIFNHTSESLEDIELSRFLKLVDRLGQENMTVEEVKNLILSCTDITLFKEGMTVHLTKQTVRSLIEINQDPKLWKAVWKDISRLAGRLNFSYIADFGEIDEGTLEKYSDLLQHGAESVRHIRLMVVGMFGVGKTTIIRRLCKQDFENVISTVGIDVSVNACEVDDQRQWKIRDLKVKPKNNYQHRIRLAYQSKTTTKVSQGKKTNVKPDKKEDLPKAGTLVETTRNEEVEEENENRFETLTDVAGKDVPSPPKADRRQNMEKLRKNIKVQDNELIEDVKVALDDGKEDESENRLTTVSIWDFAGQSIYYSTHHFFLSARAIYLLVLDISRDLSAEVQEDEPSNESSDRPTSMPKGFTCLDAFKFWMNSIYNYTAARKDQESKYKPTIVLVGTFKDKVREDKARKKFSEKSKQDDWLEIYKEDYFNDALHSFIGTEIIKLVHDTKFFVSKNDPDEIFDTLKEELTLIAEDQPFWDELVPVSWMPLEREIELRKDQLTSTETGIHDKKSTIMELHELEKIDEKTVYPLSDKKQFKLFLNFQHALGNVLYYDTEQLDDNIILDPQWILDVFKLFVAHVKKKRLIQLDEWIKYENNAILSQPLIDELIKQSSNESFQKYKEKIVHYMEYLDVIAKPVTFDDEPDETGSSEDEEEDGPFRQSLPNSRQKDFYIVPCMLSQKPSEEHVRTKTLDNVKLTPILCLVFKNNFLPAFVCHRLMATCIRRWEVPDFKKKQLMLFNGMGRFYLNSSKTTWLDLRWKDFIIYIQIFRCSTKGRPVDGKTCGEVRKQIKSMISQIFSIHRRFTGNMADSRKVLYDEYIKCPECSANKKDPAQSEGDKDCVSLSDMINVRIFEKSEEANCNNYHTLSRDEALSCWFFEENHDYKDKRIHNLRKQVYDLLTENPADSEVTERHLTELSEGIGKEYIALGIELGLTLETIERIEMEEPNIRTRIKKILMEWKKSCMIPPTIIKFKSAFDKITGFRFEERGERSKEIVKWYEKIENPSDSPEDKELIEVIHLVGRRYGRLAKKLFGTNMYATVEQIEMQYSLDFNRTLVILLKWKREAANVTFTFLKDCLVNTFKMNWEKTKKRIAEDEEKEARRAVERKNMMEFQRQFKEERQDPDDGNRVRDMLERLEGDLIPGLREELLYSRQKQVEDQTSREETKNSQFEEDNEK